jgi:hypothetical protein
MGFESRADLFGGIGPLHTAVKAFGILTKDHHVYVGLNDLIPGTANHIQRIPFQSPARADADIEIEMLTQTDNRAVVNESLVPELRVEFPVSLIFWLGCDCAEKADSMRLEKIQSAAGQRISFTAPDFPSDVGMDVLGRESCSMEHPERIGKKCFPNAVAGHDYNLSFIHTANIAYSISKCATFQYKYAISAASESLSTIGRGSVAAAVNVAEWLVTGIERGGRCAGVF